MVLYTISSAKMCSIDSNGLPLNSAKKRYSVSMLTRLNISLSLNSAESRNSTAFSENIDKNNVLFILF